MSRDSELQTSFSTSRLYQSVSYSGLRNLAQLTWLLVQKSRPQIRNPNQSRFTGAKNYGLKTEIWLSVLMKEMREWSRQLKNFVCIEGSWRGPLTEFWRIFWARSTSPLILTWTVIQSFLFMTIMWKTWRDSSRCYSQSECFVMVPRRMNWLAEVIELTTRTLNNCQGLSCSAPSTGFLTPEKQLLPIFCLVSQPTCTRIWMAASKLWMETRLPSSGLPDQQMFLEFYR